MAAKKKATDKVAAKSDATRKVTRKETAKKNTAAPRLGLDVDGKEFELKLTSEPFSLGAWRTAVKIVDVYGNESTLAKELGS